MGEPSRKRPYDDLRRNLHASLDLLLDSVRYKKKITTEAALEFARTINNHVNTHFGACGESIPDGPLKSILEYVILEGKTGAVVPQVCKKWRNLYNTMEEQRLEAFLEMKRKPHAIWWHIMIFLFKSNLLDQINDLGGSEVWYDLLHKGPRSGHESNRGITFRATLSNTQYYETSWSYKTAMGMSHEFFNRTWYTPYSFTLITNDELKKKYEVVWEFLRKQLGILSWMTKTDRISFGKVNEKPYSDEFRQALIVMNKTHRMF